MVVVHVRVGVDVEVAFFRLPRRFGRLREVRSARYVQWRVSLSTNVLRSIRRLRCVIEEVLRSIAPVFRVCVGYGVRFVNVARRVRGVFGVFFEYFLRLLYAVFRQAFARWIGCPTSYALCPVCEDATVRGSRRLRFIGRVPTNDPIACRFGDFGFTVQCANQNGLCPICLWVFR